MPLTKEEWRKYQDYIARTLGELGIVVTAEERENLEVADFGLGDFESQGLGVLTYVNTTRCCAKELVMLPFQTCPQHRHPPVEGEPGKEETFRVRKGICTLYVDDGPPPATLSCEPPTEYCRPLMEVVMRPGEQYTLKPNTWHWFQAGPDGCVVSEFSTRSRDESDVWTDPNIQRTPVVED
ncbi:MAG TPA: D-lyxose/D-mannose family sugar isomerase [Armatimonadota bacterium]|jgi:D-lyxose ketol-isomerase